MRLGWVGIFAFALPLLVPVNPARAGAAASFRYPLSNFSGPVRSQWARLAVDRERNEVYSLHQRKNDIRVFDEHGMEIFVFGDGFASATDIAIGDDGDIFLLSRGHNTANVHLLNYRGEPVSEIPLQNVPEEISEFAPDRIVYEKGSLYLVDSDALMVVVTDEAGRFKEAHDLNEVLKPFVTRLDRESHELSNEDWKRKKLEDIDLNGFTVDGQGNMFFTVPVLFSGYKVSPDGEVTSFGRSGSSPGKFGVVAGIATDEMGHVYVADRLRCVVLVFDQNLQFLTEFGYRGDKASNLIVPDDLAIDNNGNVYVGQAANRGVAVFRVAYENSSPAESYEGESRSPDRERASRTSRSKRSRAGENASRSDARERTSRSKRSKTDESNSRSDAREKASRSRSSSTKSTDSEKYGRAIEENASERTEFIVDHGDDAPSAGSEKGGWTVEGNESNQLEIIGNEDDQ